MATNRVFIEEWHFGDEGWIFRLGDHVRLPCLAVDQGDRHWLRTYFDDELAQTIAFDFEDAASEQVLVSGAITTILELTLRYPSPLGGAPIPGSGRAREVAEARGGVRLDATHGVVTGFLIDVTT